MIRFFILLFFIVGNSLVLSSQEREINIDINNIKGLHDKFFRHSVGSGHASLGLRNAYLDHLQIVKEECGFDYLRFHGIFHDDMRVFDYEVNGGSVTFNWKYQKSQENNVAEMINSAEKKPVYNWQYVDMLYDGLLDKGVKPFVELGFMPGALASGSSTVFWWEGNTSPPVSYEQWGELVREFAKHLAERYGEQEIKSWFFEVWNEPNGSFWKGSKEEYFKLYEYSARAIKSVNPDFLVGGPATGGGKWLDDFIEFCYTNEVPVDFVTTHTYGTKGGFFDEFGVRHLFVREDFDRVSSEIDAIYEEVSSSKLPGLPIYLTEWSSSFSSRDPVHDHYFQAAYILNKIKKAEGQLESMSYWTFTDVFEESGPPPTPFHGGFGLLNLQGIKKPSFFAYKYLNQLGKWELNNEDSLSWACKSENEVQILLWDYNQPVQGDTSNQHFYIRDIPPTYSNEVNISINNLEKGKYYLNVYKTGYRQNDAFANYYDLGLPGGLKKSEEQSIKEQNNDSPVFTGTIRIGKSEAFKHTLNLRENEIALITLEKR